ncbi:MAG TPA: ABC transporter permease [Dehalococcoidia bacterium]|nr:ABC transporter permease [Dehalococcoidia bacterium]
MLRTLYIQSVYSYKALFNWRNPPAFVAFIVVTPAIYVAMFGLMGRFARDEVTATAFIIGMTANGVAQNLTGGVLQSLTNERNNGTLAFVFASRGSRLSTFLTRGVLHVPTAGLSLISCLLTATLFLGADLGPANWGAVLACYGMMAVSGMCFALCGGNLAMTVSSFNFVYYGMFSFFFILTGAIIPRSELPWGLRVIGEAMPVTHALAGLRKAYNGAGFESVGGDLGREALVALAYVAVGYVLFRIIEVYQRHTGAYED